MHNNYVTALLYLQKYNNISKKNRSLTEGYMLFNYKYALLNQLQLITY